MIIAQISDTHLMLDTPDADRRMHDFASTIADINALDPAPDVIVHTGDIAHNGRAANMRERRRYSRLRARLSMCWPVIGTIGEIYVRHFRHAAISRRVPIASISLSRITRFG
jgi:3',5'-cyclic AMP phosphodiesterase CpdA